MSARRAAVKAPHAAEPAIDRRNFTLAFGAPRAVRERSAQGADGKVAEAGLQQALAILGWF
jgi:hypothetical protein